MTFSTQAIRTPIPTRQDFANAFGNNQRLIRFFEQLTNDVRQTIPDAIVSVQDIGTAPFVLQSASPLTPNGFVLQAGTGLTKASAPGTLTLALSTPVSIALGGTGATTAATALANLGGVTAAQAAAAAPVQSVFTRTGNVVAQSGDYTAAQVTGAAATANPLSQFAATTSAQLAGVLTDETGTGLVVFGTAPTLNQPNIVGVTTVSNAAAGSVGERISASVAAGAPVAITSGTALTVTSINLTPGDWDVTGQVSLAPAGTTAVSWWSGSSSLTTNVITGGNAFVLAGIGAGIVGALSNPIPTVRVNVSVNTTIFLVAQAVFSVSTCGAWGFIGARRIR